MSGELAGTTFRERDRAVHAILGEVDGYDGVLLLSYLIWPDEPPDPRAVDAWVRAHAASQPAPPASTKRS